MRPVAEGLLYHAVNRGDNRARVFFAAADYHAFLEALAKTQQRYPFRLYGYCLRTNPFHLLSAPEAGVSISRILQSLTVAPTWHSHRRRGGVGHVWQGRFKSPVVQDDDHALVVLRYIEVNPLRARMVADLAGYPWSSYGAHGLGRDDGVVRPLSVWEALERDPEKRRAYWRKWAHTALTESELAGVRKSAASGRPFGDAAWTEAKAVELGLPTSPKPRGRPRKDRKR